MKRNHQVIEPDNTCVDACSCTSSTFQVWLKLSMINAFKLTSMGSKLSSKLSLIACPFSNLGSPTILKIGWLKISLFGELWAKFKNRYFGPILPSKMSWEFKVAAGTDLLVYDCEKRAFFTIKLHLWLKEQVGNKKMFLGNLLLMTQVCAQPICALDGTSLFFSPCHAGCQTAAQVSILSILASLLLMISLSMVTILLFWHHHWSGARKERSEPDCVQLLFLHSLSRNFRSSLPFTQ